MNRKEGEVPSQVRKNWPSTFFVEFDSFRATVEKECGLLIEHVVREGFPPGVQVSTSKLNKDITVNVGFTICGAASDHNIEYELLSSEINAEPETIVETFHVTRDKDRWDPLRVRYHSASAAYPRWNLVSVSFNRNGPPSVKGLRIK